ncbi:MAG: class I SAM-dependent methyltransferase [Treponema sp.]|nr:class I SAM-dependent methyltransferase [Treponema sp.]
MDKNQTETIKSYDKSANEFMQKIGKLNNYNGTYDFLLDLLKENDNILDLACGPAQISSYIKNKKNVNITGVDLSKEMIKIAKKNVPDGNFICDSIITYKSGMKFNLIIIGFGIPYLNKKQIGKCIKNSVIMLEKNGYFYISFMNGNKYGFEETSFGGKNKYFIYYHEKGEIINLLENNGIGIIKDYKLNYTEMDGSITEDIILIGRKLF